MYLLPRDFLQSPYLDIFKIQLYIVINNGPRRLSMRRRIRHDNLQKPLPTSTTLWFCGTELISKSIKLILPLPIRTHGQWFYKNTFSSARVKSVTSYLIFRHYKLLFCYHSPHFVLPRVTVNKLFSSAKVDNQIYLEIRLKYWQWFQVENSSVCMNSGKNVYRHLLPSPVSHSVPRYNPSLQAINVRKRNKI